MSPDAGVARGERVRQIAAAERQIHRQERRVRDRVRAPEPLAELDAVDRDEIIRRGAVGEVVDVIEVQIAVRVTRYAASGTRLDERLKPRRGYFVQRAEAVEHAAAHGNADLRASTA